jgi:hypothetical protein
MYNALEKDEKASGRGLIKALAGNLSDGTEENHDDPVRIADILTGDLPDMEWY